jgi:class 3 adenylate cyclase
MSKEVPPAVVMKFLNDLFGRFDRLLSIHKVQKVETAGDCYIVAAGVLAVGADGFSEVLSSHDSVLSAARVLSFAQAMLYHSKLMTMPHNGEPVLIRIGIHTGDCVSGLVGSTLHKFGLFGDTMNTSSRMESTCMPGRIQISASTYAKLHPDQRGHFEATGGVEVKGKGQMETYLLVESSRAPEIHSSDPGSNATNASDLNILLCFESNDPERTPPVLATQLSSYEVQDIMKSLSKVSGGSQKRPTFEVMTQACQDAVSLLHSMVESKAIRPSSMLNKIPSTLLFKLPERASPGPTSQNPRRSFERRDLIMRKSASTQDMHNVYI